MECLECSDSNLSVGELVLNVRGDISPAVSCIDDVDLTVTLGNVGNITVGVLTSENGKAA